MPVLKACWSRSVGNYLTTATANAKRALGHVGPLIDERRRWIAEEGQDYAGKPNDGPAGPVCIRTRADYPAAWAELRSCQDLCKCMSSLSCSYLRDHSYRCQTCINALYTLAAYPKYVATVRGEVAAITQKHGWTKASMAEMLKLDSFLKEYTRYYSFSACRFPMAAIYPLCCTHRQRGRYCGQLASCVLR